MRPLLGVMDPLPHSVNKFIIDDHGATPDEIIEELDLDDSYRQQLEHFCAVTRYNLFKDREENDAEGLRWDRVEWDDVADWNVDER